MTSPDPSSSHARPESSAPAQPEPPEPTGADRPAGTAGRSGRADPAGPVDPVAATAPANQADQAQRPDKPERAGKPDQRAEPERAEQPAKPGQAEQAGQPEPPARTRLTKTPRATAGSGAAGAGRGATRSGQRARPAGRSASPSRDADTDAEVYEDRVYRSTGAMATGVLLLVLGAWLGGDALVRGEGRTPWLSLSGLLLVVPLVVAFTLRPAVFAGADRLLVRNPFRTITLPWQSVEGARAGYSSEVLAGGRKYQLWAIPVSLRQRKRASRQQARAAAEDVSGRAPVGVRRGDTLADSGRAPSDQAIDDIRELAERHATRPGAQGQPTARWAWEVLAPAAVGAVLLIVLASTG